MQKTLTKHGHSWALVIDKPNLELLKIDPTAPLELTTDGQKLVITPAASQRRKPKVAAAREKVNRCYTKVSKKLAE